MELAVADNGEDAYYWYKGEKHYLTPDYSSSFIVYDGSASTVSNQAILLGGDYHSTNSGLATRAFGSQNKKWAIVDGSALQSRSGQDAANISYQSPVYKSAKTGNTVRLSNLIHLKLKSQADSTMMYEQIENMACLFIRKTSTCRCGILCLAIRTLTERHWRFVTCCMTRDSLPW